MKNGDKIIWDSGFGYEIGYYRADEGVMYGTCLVDLRTGIAIGEVSMSKIEIHPYTIEKIAELTAKYKYEKTFSETF